MCELFNYDSNYTEKITPEEIIYPENQKNIIKRVKDILKHIITVHGSNNDNIILCTHQIICNVIMKIINKHGILKPNDEQMHNYPKGGITLIMDDSHWIFKPINW